MMLKEGRVVPIGEAYLVRFGDRRKNGKPAQTDIGEIVLPPRHQNMGRATYIARLIETGDPQGDTFRAELVGVDSESYQFMLRVLKKLRDKIVILSTGIRLNLDSSWEGKERAKAQEMMKASLDQAQQELLEDFELRLLFQ